MDNDRYEGQWKQMKGRIKEQWGVLSDDDLKEAEGHEDYLVGRIQEKTGERKDAIRSRLREMERSL